MKYFVFLLFFFTLNVILIPSWHVFFSQERIYILHTKKIFITTKLVC